MLVLGIDPAIRNTGYGVIEVIGANKFKIVDCGLIKNRPNMPHSECLRRLAGGIRELLATYPIDTASIEDPFVGKNPSTAIILGMARGAILSVLAEMEISAYAYTPRHAKKIAVGTGNATKEQVAYMMAAELNISIADIPLDATDALALAVCHAQIASRPELMSISKIKPL